MSVDKFGRYSELGVKSGSYGKRNGLPLTPDGDYDISNKRLKFVRDPKDDNDAINLKTLKSEVSSTLKLEENTYNANSYRITNLGKPIEKSDSVNKEYLLYHINNGLRLNGKTYDAKDYRITNIADPINDKDSVTKKYLHSVIPIKTTDKYSFNNFVINDIGYPKAMNDAVNLKYLKENCITHDVGTIDCKNKALTNVQEGFAKSDAATISQIMEVKNNVWFADNKKINGVIDGTDPKDVTTVQQMEGWCIGKDKYNQEVYTCNNRRLTQLKDPESLEDAVNVNYLVRILGQILVDFHNNIFDNTKSHSIMGNEEAKSTWIQHNIVIPYFINPQTKLFRTANPYTVFH